MKRPFKKLTAWLCCMAMLISFIPATALPVFADEAEGEVEWTVINVTQTEGVLPAPEENSSYELESDLTLTGDLTVPGYIGVDQVVTLDLAGHDLIAGETADGGLFAVDDAAGHLTITDSVGGGRLVSGTSAGTPAVQVQAGEFTLEAGEITGWIRAGSAGGMVFVGANGTFNMDGGKLTGANSAYGSAIRCEGGVVNMTGGEISGNTVTDRAVIRLASGSEMTMTGGEIKNNTATNYAAGVRVLDGATFTMTGGTITGNTAKYGAGVYSEGTTEITGGTLTGNEATASNGGAVYVKAGETTVGGDAIITENTAVSYAGGIFVDKNATLNIEGGEISENSAQRGAGVSGAEAGASNVTINISGGTIENNHGTQRGANLYGYDATYNISGGTIGAATHNGAAATGLYNAEARGGVMNISGGTIAQIATNKGTDFTTTAITGNPVITSIAPHASGTNTIGELTEGANVTSSEALTVLDNRVAVNGKVYTYTEPQLPTSGTVMEGEYVLAGDLVLTNTLTVAADTEVTIDLAGNTISMPDKDAVYFVVNGKLTIKDSVGGGKVQMKNTAAGHGGIYVYGTGTFVLEGGEITGWTRINDGSYGAGGMFGLWDGATFTMTGGKITGADCGSNTVIRTQSAGAITVTISGGEISGNHAQSGGIIAVSGTADKNATLTINGTAKIDGNTWGANNVDFAPTGTGHEIAGLNTHITIGGSAIVGGLYNDAENNTTDNSSYTITGAPTVASVRWSAGAETPVSITELTEGASITMSSTASEVDATVARTTTDDNRYLYTYKVPTYAVTVNQVAGGTVEVDVTEGAAGATVTVTATAGEGYELVNILVNGVAIQGNTFQIVAGDNVVTATFEAVDAGLPTSGSVAAGEYVLAADHVLTNQLSFVNGVDVVIDLAGHTITMPDVDGYYFNIDATSKLTIKDSVGGGKVQFKNTKAGNAGINVNGTFVLEGGELNGWSRVNDGVYGAGGMMNMWPNSTFIMTGGTITGCECSGDVVIRNQNVNDGGRTVIITGGTITGNNANSGTLLSVAGVDANPSTLTIGGDAVITGNTKAGAALDTEEVYGAFTHVTIGGNATVGSVYTRASDAVEGVEGFPYGSLTINGAAKVGNITMNSSARTPLAIKELTEGAEIKTAMALGASQKDATVATSAADENGIYTYTWQDPATVVYTVTVGEVENGTVTVTPAEGVIGTSVTINAEPAEGYVIGTFYVDGKAIPGATFTITGNHTVTATFTEIVEEGFPTSGVVAAGEYVLTEDVTLTGWLTIRDEVVIDLAGHTITAGEGGNVFLLDKEASKLTLMDSVGGGKVQSGASTGNPAVFLQVAGAQFILDGGEITGWNRAGGAGGMVYLLAGTTFTMNGGKLTGASCAGNAIIRTGAGESTITINGGEISGNSVTGNAPIGLASGVTMTITDGTFTGNSAGSYAGLIQVASGATLNISGGTFTENSAVTGGGVIYNEGTVSITGGTFTGNEVTGTASGNQGGVIQILKGSTTTINGGTFTGNSAYRGGAIGTGENVVAEGRPVLNIGGTASISGNSGVTHGANIYAYTTNVTISGGTIGTAVLNGADAGKNYGNIYLRGNSTTNLESTLTITGGNLHGIRADNYTASVSGNPVIGEIQNLNSTVTMSNLTTGASIRTATVDTVTVAEGDETVYTTNDRDYYFKGDMGFGDKFVPGATVTLTEDSSVGGGIVLTEAGNYILDLAGYTLTGNAAPYFTVGAGVKLTVIDSSENKTGKVVGLTTATEAMILVDGGEFVLNDGALTGHTSTKNGGAIRVKSGSATMNGGSITGNTAVPTFTWNEDKQTYTLSNGYGAGVYLEKGAAFTMNGGEISGNTASRGAGVTGIETGSANITITLNGGTIKDNTAYERGANVYAYDPALVTFGEVTIGASYDKNFNGTPELEDDTVTLTTATYRNTEVRGGNAAITGGTIKLISLGKGSAGVTGTISGAPKIELLNANNSNTTIGNLTSGARVAVDTNYPLTVAEGDTTVYAEARLYRYAADLTSVLVIGNSFGGDTINYLAKLGGFYGKEIKAANMYIGSQNFRWHALSLAESLRNEDLNGDGTIGDSRQTKYDGYNEESGRYEEGLYTVNGYSTPMTIPGVLDAGVKWDYIVLQNGVEYVGFEGTYNSDVQFLIDYIQAVQPEAKIFFNQTWAEETGSSYLTQFGGSQKTMYNAILANTEKFFTADDARFGEAVEGYFPIGTAIQMMRDTYSATPLTRDGFHLSLNAGRMIAGLTVMKTLFDIDLSELTAADMTALFDKAVGETTDSSNDAFDPTEENVAKLIAAVEAACGYAAAGTVAEGYADAADTANKQFNPDAAVLSSNEFVAVYENVTEVGQALVKAEGEILRDGYATVGAGKIVIYKNGTEVGAIDELWLEENAGIVLTDRYNKIANGEEYYIIADAQAPQLAVVGSKLYMTFDVKLYTDDGQIINGGIYMTTSTDGVTWTPAVKVSDSPMAYGLTALSDGNLILSVNDTTTKAVKIDTAGAVVSSVELCTDIADVAFAEVDGKIFALSSTGAVYVSADNGATWTATGITAGATASPNMVTMLENASKGWYAVYVTWADEAESKIYSKVWTIDTSVADYGWSSAKTTVLAEYTPATAYNGKTSGGQPATFWVADGSAKTVYVSGNKLVETEKHAILTSVSHSLTLAASLTVNFLFPKKQMDALGAEIVEVTCSNPYSTKASETLVFELDETFTTGGVTYYNILVERAAKEMGDSLVAVVYDAEGYQVSFEDKYSVRTYIDNQLAKPAYANAKEGTENAAFRTVMVDLLNYGAAAQTYFKYATEDLVNAKLTAEQQSWASAELVVGENLTTNGEVNTTNGISSNKSLMAEAVIEVLLLYRVGTVDDAAYAKVSYVTHGGTVADNVRYELTDFRTGGMDFKQVKVDTLGTADVSTKIICELYDANDNLMEGSRIEYSIETYCYNQISKGRDIAPVCMKLMQAGRSAYNYLHFGE